MEIGQTPLVFDLALFATQRDESQRKTEEFPPFGLYNPASCFSNPRIGRTKNRNRFRADAVADGLVKIRGGLCPAPLDPDAAVGQLSASALFFNNQQSFQ